MFMIETNDLKCAVKIHLFYLDKSKRGICSIKTLEN
ncbi:Uncharacterised protein [Anaerobiospirillum thomasii]|uniref:Uncharacterized protein n=1 Tax=Anaerobiospirillum thomasii TaxID=179995 RepID=A0A2X0V1A5_9GAMM|nr:Uncharacterised protein [Anaerobiospirillum thomasii]SPT70727.1 Uncharacterised protein [Anaerobiospirillum thomasii]